MPKFSLCLGVLVLVALLTSNAPACGGSDCGELCDPEFWETASVEGVLTELVAGADLQPAEYGLTEDFTILHLAVARNENPEVIRLLIRWGADVNARSGYDLYAPLHLAAWFRNVAITSVLLEQGANIHAKDRYGETPLHHAAGWNDVAVVSLLIEQGANIHSVDRSGATPLHEAAGRGFVRSYDAAIVSLLIEQGGDIHAIDRHGQTPCELRKENDDLSDTDALARLCQ